MDVTEEEYREAYLLWKKQKPTEKKVKNGTIVTLENGKKVPLGNRLKQMRLIYKEMQKKEYTLNYTPLTEEQIEYWKNQDVDLLSSSKTKFNEQLYRDAYSYWQKTKLSDEILQTSTKVIMEDGTLVNLGRRIEKMRCIYSAMQGCE